MTTGLLELLLSLSSAGSGGEKAVNKTQPAQPPAIVAPSQSEAKRESKPTVEEEVRRLAKRVIKLLKFDDNGGGSNGNGP